MKFLCLQCDEQMKLVRTGPPDGDGSLSVFFGCPRCSIQVCLLTNPWETQVVTSLGVKIGRPGGDQEEKAAKCPFGDVVREMGLSETSRSESPQWTRAALARLENIPEFVRPMARQGIEHFARGKGYRQIDEAVLDEAREQFGM